MKAWKVIFAAVLLFTAGAATGVAVSRIQSRVTVRVEAATPNPLPAIAWQRYEFLRRAQRELKLSDEQKARIAVLVKESQERFRKLWEPVAPQARTEFEALREQIRGELKPAQQERFDELLRKSEKDRRRTRDATNSPAGDKPMRVEKK